MTDISNNNVFDVSGHWRRRQRHGHCHGIAAGTRAQGIALRDELTLGTATSSSGSKLIHGGLALFIWSSYEFRLGAGEALGLNVWRVRCAQRRRTIMLGLLRLSGIFCRQSRPSICAPAIGKVDPALGCSLRLIHRTRAL